MSQVSKIVFAIVFIGPIMSSDQFDQMSQRSQFPSIAPVGCSLMEAQRYIGGKWVCMYVGRSFRVRSCLLISLAKCHQDHKSRWSLFNVKNQKCPTQCVRESVSQRQGYLLSCLWTAKKKVVGGSKAVYKTHKKTDAPSPQLLPGCVEFHCLQCKNCQYRFLGQYPSKMYDFFSWAPFTKRDDYQPPPGPFKWSQTHSTGPVVFIIE